MRKKVLLACGCGFLLAGVLLIAAAFLTIGINDGERRSISQTGSFSKPGELVWTQWAGNDGSIKPFPGFHSKTAQPESGPSEVRRGEASGVLFDFTVYEMRTVAGDPDSALPAIGPDWGSYYHAVWAFAALAAAVIFFILAFYLREGYR
jgi:hypothetical protein